MEFIELEKIYRQSDKHFIKLLNSIRNNSITDLEIQEINKRCDQKFEAAVNDFYMYLMPTNNKDKIINEEMLGRVKIKEFTFAGKITGDFGKEYLPTLSDLKIKIGAQVMMINNDSENRWVNGSVAKIITIEGPDDNPKIIVKLEDGVNARVKSYKWELYNFYLDGIELKSK